MPQAVETVRFEQDCIMCARSLTVDMADERCFVNDPDDCAYMDGEVTFTVPPVVGMGNVDFECPACGREQSRPIHTALSDEVRAISGQWPRVDVEEEDLPEDPGPDPYADVHPWYHPEGPWGPPPAEL